MSVVATIPASGPAAPPCPIRLGEELSDEAFARVRRGALFECCKWDPQIEDVSVLARFPLLLEGGAWAELARLAEGLAAEALAAEAELADRPDLHGELGLGGPIRRALARGRGRGAGGGLRVLRFDFHWTADGWRISEVNSDVPGGYNEASGLARLMADETGGQVAGDPADALAEAIARAAGPHATVGMVHATAYADDRQVNEFLAGRWSRRGLKPVMLAPDHVRWADGAARSVAAWHDGPIDLLFRFFPVEWLTNLPRRSGWHGFFDAAARTPQCNPTVAALIQSKRFPLVWDRLAGRMDLWRRLLPASADPRQAAGRPDGWVFKPAMGRVGEDVAIAGVTPPADWSRILRAARRRPGRWVAQRRFEALPLTGQGRTFFPCIGVYVIDGRAGGAYGRLADRPLIDQRANEAAVLIDSRPRGREDWRTDA